MWISAAIFVALGLVAAPAVTVATAMLLALIVDLYAARSLARASGASYARSASVLVLTAGSSRLLFYCLGYGVHQVWRYLLA